VLNSELSQRSIARLAVSWVNGGFDGEGCGWAAAGFRTGAPQINREEGDLQFARLPFAWLHSIYTNTIDHHNLTSSQAVAPLHFAQKTGCSQDVQK
jgi:hypothetical protein